MIAATFLAATIASGAVLFRPGTQFVNFSTCTVTSLSGQAETATMSIQLAEVLQVDFLERRCYSPADPGVLRVTTKNGKQTILERAVVTSSAGKCLIDFELYNEITDETYVHSVETTKVKSVKMK